MASLFQARHVATESQELQRLLRIRWTAAIGFIACSIGLLAWLTAPPARATVIRRAESLLHDRKAKEALDVLMPLLNRIPADGDACQLAGEANVRLRQFDGALRWFGAVPPDHPLRAAACLKGADILLLQRHQLSPAEAFLREALSLRPDHPAAEGYLAGLYGMCGLTSLTSGLRSHRLTSGQFAEVDLLLLALGETAAENAGALQQYIRTSPDDPLTQIAHGRQAWLRHDLPEARHLYSVGLSQRPDLIDAQAQLGRILFDQSDAAAFLAWHAGLSPTAEEHPDVWVLRGDWSWRDQDLAGGVRCYQEAARRDPAHRRAHYQLGQALLALGETSLAQRCQRRNADLQDLLIAAKQWSLDHRPAGALRAAEAAARCGHPWEAWGWTEVARRGDSKLASPRVARPATGSPRFLETALRAPRFDVSRFPMPRWMQHGDAATAKPDTVVQSDTAGIQFTDDSVRTGLKFQYVSGDDIPGPGKRMFQFTGGGVGALDYDRDGWADLYFTQGGRWPVPEENPPIDILFRNLLGESFRDVSRAAGLHEADYSQGLTVADFNSDGFPDLFIANVNGNRLFRNAGDGTFQEVTDAAAVKGKGWATSAVGADFNGDGLADLFVVNYVQGPGLLERICQQANGTPRACTPYEFEAADDQLLLNLGDGRFQDVTAQSGVLAPGGKGLGVVAGRFEQGKGLDLFVANDTTANFFLQNRSSPGAIPKFEESAVYSGLAFDGEGRSQACMGIAADDADGNGLLDLFVTNYYNESNTLYLQQPTATFTDATVASGLREASLKQLGFGAQFFDADLDGWPDLVVTNGHIDDETSLGNPHQMPTQVFRNLGKGRFVEVPAAQLGEWFQGRYLGRGLARLDWNRDGRDDFAVSLMDTPSALLTNQSVPRGQFLTLQLVGTQSARDPIGAIVRVQTKERSILKQLTAGDGFQASNEQQLLFGVGAAGLVDITIHWPSGRTQTYPRIASGTRWVAIEGKTELVGLNP